MLQQQGKIFNEQRALLLLVLIAYVAIVFVAGYMPRGSDQYWSLGNVDRVIHHDGLFKTNNIFPAGMPEDMSLLPRPWVQNRPVVYLVIGIAWIVRNAQFAWLICNLASLLITCWLLLRTLRITGITGSVSVYSFCLLLLFPLNFYLVMQALPEQFNQLLVMAVFGLLLFNREKYGLTLLAAIVSGLLVYQRDNFVLLLILAPLYLFFSSSRDTRVSHAFLFFLIMGLMYMAKPVLLPSHTIEPISISKIISEVRPGKHNMVNYLYPNTPDRPTGEVIKIVFSKAANSLTRQFSIDKSNSVFIYSINLLLIPFFILLFRYRNLDPFKQKGVFLTGIFFLIHLLTIVLFENQYRFSAVLIPLLILNLAWLVGSANDARTRKWLFPAILLLCVLIDGVIAYSNRKEARINQQVLTGYQDLRKNELHGKPVMVHWTSGESLIVSYGLLPQYCYYFPGDAPAEELLSVAKKLGASHFIVKQGSGIYKQLKPLSTKEQITEPAKKITLLQVER